MDSPQPDTQKLIKRFNRVMTAVNRACFAAREDERKKVSQEIFHWLDNQEYFHEGDGTYEQFIKEYNDLKKKYGVNG